MVTAASISFSGQTPHTKKIEKKIQKINLLATGIVATGVAGTAVVSGAISHAAGKKPDGKLAKTGRVLYQPVKYLEGKAESLLKASKKKLSGGKLENAYNATKKFAATHYNRIPKRIKVATGILLGLLTLSHFYRKGQINGVCQTAGAANQACQNAYMTGYKHAEKTAIEASLGTKIEEGIEKIQETILG